MTTGNDFGGGVNRLLEGMAFSLGLILVIVAGAARTMVLTALRQDPARPSSIFLWLSRYRNASLEHALAARSVARSF
jgi:ABC-type transport system involved in cytochrome c biogenesis permease subunit